MMLLTRIPKSESSWGLKSKPKTGHGKNSISSGTKFAPWRFVSFEILKNGSLNLHKRQTLAAEVLDDLKVFEHLQIAAYGKIAAVLWQWAQMSTDDNASSKRSRDYSYKQCKDAILASWLFRVLSFLSSEPSSWSWDVILTFFLCVCLSFFLSFFLSFLGAK